MIKTAHKYYNTLRYLKWKQFTYRILGMIYQPKLELMNNATSKKPIYRNINIRLSESISSLSLYKHPKTFNFLNIEHTFDNGLDWNFDKYGKLWTYNLNYFEYLSQNDLSKKEGLLYIHDFINNEQSIIDGMEPYPISIRLLFWIKFLIKHDVNDDIIDRSLYRQLIKLSKKPEYHLMGNHLMENGVALLFAGIYFQENKYISQGNQILSDQLNEQILSDGGHFELSPMYHQIMLYRLLDCYNLLKSNPEINLSELKNKIKSKCSKMLGWTEQMTFSNGSLPNLNDSTLGISPQAETIWDYAQQLGIRSDVVKLGASGYRKMHHGDIELMIDVGHIGPDYIPGHAHSDTFNFVLHHRGEPIIVDTGISTYEKNKLRTSQRSTSAHNTVMVDSLDQSEVWGGFRVARRAKVLNLKEVKHKITATHDGYLRIGVKHQRTFNCTENRVRIHDELSKLSQGMAFLHFHPSVSVRIDDNKIQGKFGTILFDNADDINLTEYKWAEGFNKTRPAKVVSISFSNHLTTTITTS